ncbi:MAG TPA: histidine ammonia-lyase [Pyrinomonadaceae bacterium]|jgi:histidine ammonia-lyase|nr:histidine ammonia-lyase [Pyrinomonadaceae bacterium]
MLELDGQSLTLGEVARVARGESEVRLGAAARARMEASRAAVERIISESRVVYGVNTGFGKLSDVTVPPDELRALQVNLVRSHACGVGPALSEEETRALMLLRANVLAKGLSGARPVVAETLLRMLARGVVPVIPEKGSVGASGDLAPLSHLALCCIGEGEAFYKGERLPGGEALRRAGLEPLQLEAKEGLALLNGTQALTAVGALAVERAERVARTADASGAMSLEALKGTPAAFDERIHLARPHKGQQEAAAHLRELLRDSEIRASHLEGDPRVQDAYSLRCMPQVHGAARDALAHARAQIETETGGATDNPLVFADRDEVISGGNFHGAPVAIALDYAAIALVHLGNIVERRVDRLVNPDKNEGLPPFLTARPGVESGYMVAQIVAVALLNECKVLAHPATTDNLPTDGGKEDHVSMGMTAATKLRRVVENVEAVVAIELLAAAEGLEYRAPLLPGRGARRAYEAVRAHAPRLTGDRPLAPDIERVAAALRRGEFDV